MKILLYEMKFLVPNYSCWLGGYRPQIPVLSVLCLQLNLLNPPPAPLPNKIPGYAIGEGGNPCPPGGYQIQRKDSELWNKWFT